LARDLYSPSALFRGAFLFASKKYGNVGILSAKYGFLFPEDPVEPYEITLNNFNIDQRKKWAERVFQQMDDKLDISILNDVYFHAGVNYREHLIPKLSAKGIRCQVPLVGLTLGQQISWYSKHKLT
tara:strand:+ start:259 stop:636 length:378 start_codon:yes stop_codon:yes gene_type:complete